MTSVMRPLCILRSTVDVVQSSIYHFGVLKKKKKKSGNVVQFAFINKIRKYVTRRNLRHYALGEEMGKKIAYFVDAASITVMSNLIDGQFYTFANSIGKRKIFIRSFELVLRTTL